MVDDKQFVEALHASRKTIQDTADGLSVSKPTVIRWMAGQNLPHQAMRQPILDFLKTPPKEQFQEA
jgi:hypothetical protein